MSEIETCTLHQSRMPCGWCRALDPHRYDGMELPAAYGELDGEKEPLGLAAAYVRSEFWPHAQKEPPALKPEQVIEATRLANAYLEDGAVGMAAAMAEGVENAKAFMEQTKHMEGPPAPVVAPSWSDLKDITQALDLFADAVKTGSTWNSLHQHAYDTAKRALGKLR